MATAGPGTVFAMERPSAIRWIWYALGGGLPMRYREWVLHDTTSGFWLLRHIVRVLVVLIVPTVLLVVLMPTGAYLRALTAFTTDACVVLLTAILASDMTERRLHRMGYPWGTAGTIRSQRQEDAQRASAQRYRQRRADRHG
jgi:Family of unknown function (DUF5313)